MGFKKYGKCLFNFPHPSDIDEIAAIDELVFYVYVQYRPDGTPFYVGKGSFRKGRTFRYRHTSHNNYYRRIVERHGEENIQTILWEVSDDKASSRWERELIFMLRCEGNRLANLTDGGEGILGYRHTKKTKDIISGHSKRQIWTEERRERFRVQRMSHPYYPPKTPEAKQRIIASRRGKLNTPEHNRKISASKFGHTVSQEQRDKQRATMKEIGRKKRNLKTMETPWGIMGLQDAADRIGITWDCLRKRLRMKVSPDKLFNPGHNKSPGGKMGHRITVEGRAAIGRKNKAALLQKNPLYHVSLETPWGQMRLYDLTTKLGVSWETVKDRYRRQAPPHKMFAVSRFGHQLNKY